MSFLKATAVGRLGGDPETRILQNGTTVISFSMACDGRKKDAPPTWIRVSAFAEQADRLAAMIDRGYIAKGRLLYVEGRMESREYQANGQNRTSLDVTMTDWQFVGGGEQQGNQANTTQDDSQVPF